MKYAVLITLTLVTFASPRALAQSEVWLQNGAVIQGNVVEDDGAKIKVDLVAEGGGGATSTYRYDQLHPHTIYRLRFNKTERDDVKGQIELATYALDNGVFPSARLSYDLAMQANAAKKAGMDDELAKLKARAPAVVLEWAKKKIAAKEMLDAQKALRRLNELFHETEEGAQAAKLLDEIAESCATCHVEAIEKKAPGGKTAKEAAAPAKRQYDKAHAAVRQAMAEYKRPVQMSRHLKTAISELEAAQKMLDDAMKKEGAASDLAAHYAAWSDVIRDETVDAYVSLANSYFSRQSNKDALDAVNAALLIDPKNKEALATRARIQIASSSSNRWRW